MKYNNLDLGTIEAIVNKLGGMEGVKRFLSGGIVVKDFLIWKTIKLGTYKNVDALRNSIKSDGNIEISDWANDILSNSAFTVAGAEEEIRLISVSVAGLGLEKGATYGNICAKAKELGLELCPNEVGPQLRMQYKDQPKDEWLRIAMEPIADSDGSFGIFSVGDDNNGGLWLDGCNGGSGRFWCANDRFVFRLRK